MKLLWAPNIEFGPALSTAARDADTGPNASPDCHTARVEQPFPLLIDDSGQICREAFAFLYDLSVIGPSESAKTLSTYAESLCDWLTFAERQSPPYQIPNRRRLAQYRGHLSGTSPANGRERRQLSKRTINLRLTVANEFAKFVAPDAAASDVEVGTGTNGARKKTNSSTQKTKRRRLLVKVTKSRPRILKQDAINALVETLPLPHRLAFQWQLCTGLRRGSVVALTLDHIDELCSKFSDGFITVPAKGGTTATVYVPLPLLDESVRYVQTDRMIVASTRLDDPRATVNQGALFLNTNGHPLAAECYYRAFHRACSRVGLKAKTHLARSTYATRMEQLLSELRAQGAMIDPVKIVQGLLCHADSKTTAIYLDSIASRNSNVLDALNSHARSMLLTDDHD